ncbi:MAG TPA: hypothetical protein VGI55_10750 [Solirubrobacteraceae bacterium]|jgi:hypothetical protein
MRVEETFVIARTPEVVFDYVTADGGTTRMHAEGELKGVMKRFEGVARRLLARQFAAHHRNLRRNIELSQ